MANVNNLIDLNGLQEFYKATMNTGATAPAETTALWIDTSAGETISAGNVTLTAEDLTFLKNLRQLLSLDMTAGAEKINVNSHIVQNALFE